MDTIQIYSKVSGYKISWIKYKAMPISGINSEDIMTKFGFKWIPKGMKCLGIKLCREVEEMQKLNLNPVLQKIKTNLDKWNKIRLTLWGRVNVITMVVLPSLTTLL